MYSLLSQSEKQTQRLGFALGACLREGDVVLLEGEMGAGKSVLTRAAARGLGVEGPVPSPTFTILNIHEGRAMKLYHFDLYRIEGEDALYEMGLDEFIPAGDGATLIEWPQMAAEAMPGDHLAIDIRYAQDGMAREIALEPMGAFDEGRIEEILSVMEAIHEYPDD
ncbi:MAG: tRNA (adenosine(37)-N6)-threonylcarbamoyltransferase complex ATPase subunit type 1 TsaE [Clostridia bacterium]|nr:tRNA (adenosine(37)-N6)-threonylcarbamoyltransferase complex ATPase subunit type 1 TsaE [Clostridia bacterium]